MKYQVDHDYHIHSRLSLCSDDPEQTPERILSYAKQNGYTSLCLTDHYWDETVYGASEWYSKQNTAHIRQALPLPQEEGIRFYFGAETDMDKFNTVGISDRMIDALDFLIIPTTHLHMKNFTLEPTGQGDDPDGVKRRAELWVKRFDKLLTMDLPFEKIGIAHLTCPLICAKPEKDSYLKVLDLLKPDVLKELFTRAAARGLGIELNFNSFAFEDERLERDLRIYRAAKECGCKFYFGSDAHHPAGLDAAYRNFGHIVDLLNLSEDEKFRIPLK